MMPLLHQLSIKSEIFVYVGEKVKIWDSFYLIGMQIKKYLAIFFSEIALMNQNEKRGPVATSQLFFSFPIIQVVA